MNYVITAYTVGLGLILGYALVLWTQARAKKSWDVLHTDNADNGEKR